MRGGFTTAALLSIAAGATLARAADIVRWTPRALSTPQYESSPTFSPDGREMVFFRGDPTFTHYRLFSARCRNGEWASATRPDFAAAEHIDEADPAFSANGRRLYFISSRPHAQRRGATDLDIWFVDRDANGRWLEPQRLPEPVNSPSEELLPRPQPDGSLVFGSDRPGGLGGNDIYRARPTIDGWKLDNLGAPVNTAANEYEAEVSRDGSSMFVIADRGDRSHIYPYRRTPTGWTAMPRIVPQLEVFQVGPLLSPRADRLLFSQADGARSGEWFLLDLVANPDRSWPPSCGR